MLKSPSSKPLTNKELDRLADFLDELEDETMTLEEMDGFLTALVAGPETVLPSEFLSEIFRVETSDAFENLGELEKIVGLMMQHWNFIAGTLQKGEVYEPIIDVDENGRFHGYKWACGFELGMSMRADSWKDLVENKETQQLLFPVVVLAHQYDEDSPFFDNPLTAEEHEEFIMFMVNFVPAIYDFFKDRRQQEFIELSSPVRRSEAKIGRNSPCPCGSGKRYKRCHGT